MTDIVRLLLLLGLAGAAVTLAGGLFLWFNNEERRIRRALRRVLIAHPEAVVVAHGRGRGAGFSFTTGLAAVVWDAGAWCLVYRIDELVGAELIVDGQVVARSFRGEPRRPLEQVVSQARHVTLRLVFDDPANPDFELELWQADDAARREGFTAADAVKEANRWMARAEAILRRPAKPHGGPQPPPAPAARGPDVSTRPAPAPPPPWDEEDDEDEDRDDQPPPR